MSRWIIALAPTAGHAALAASLLACTTKGVPQPVGERSTVGERLEPVTSAPPAVSGSATQPPSRCQGVGPMACSMAPSSHADLCANAEGCIRSFTKDATYVDGLSIECDGRSRTDLESAFSKTTLAPAAAGLTATSLVSVAAVRDGYTYVFGSTYLVADFADGSCLVDVVNGWDRHSSYPDTTFDTRWLPSPPGYRASVLSRRILHEVLDREELAEDVSDVTSDVCQRITYDVVDGRFTRVAERSTEGSCDGDR